METEKWDVKQERMWNAKFFQKKIEENRNAAVNVAMEKWNVKEERKSETGPWKAGYVVQWKLEM